MRIRTQLFVGTAFLVLALVGIQWWVQDRQLKDLDRQLTDMAAEVTRTLVFGEGQKVATEKNADTVILYATEEQARKVGSSPASPGGIAFVPPPRQPQVPPEKTAPNCPVKDAVVQVEHTFTLEKTTPAKAAAKEPPGAYIPNGGAVVLGPAPNVKAAAKEPPRIYIPGSGAVVLGQTPNDKTAGKGAKGVYLPEGGTVVVSQASPTKTTGTEAKGTPVPNNGVYYVRPFDVKQHTVHIRIDEKGPKRYVVINGLPHGERKIAIPKFSSSQVIQATQKQSVLAGLLLLTAGLLGGVLVAHRVTKPIMGLKRGAEALGRGELGTQVPVGARGDLRELEVTFNRMSRQLAELELERKHWKAREHLAELGGLARGLAHTLRNPLNTFGLILDELSAKTGAEERAMVGAARAQIRRIDRWVRSLLAIGRDGSLEPEEADVAQIVTDLVFESLQAGNRLEFTPPAQAVSAVVVAPAFRSALANLLENAVEASPANAAVEVDVREEGDDVRVTIRDYGAGLPEEVRQRIFSPHVTTKPEGSGMGIYLSRQLIEGIHGGKLEIGDAPGGGTAAAVSVPRVFARKIAKE